jgi:RNA polymerase sigma-70 factor, ECF subfamily
MSDSLSRLNKQGLSLACKHKRALWVAVQTVIQGNWVLADAAVEEAIIQIGASFHGFDPTGDFEVWAGSVARNVARSVARRATHQSVVMSEYSAELLVCAADLEDSGEELREARLKALPGCLARLAPTAQNLLKHRYYKKLSFLSLSSWYRKTPEALRAIVDRSRDVLAACVRKEIPRE